MHSSSFNQEPSRIQNESEVLVALTTLVTEGRIPGLGPEAKGFYEGPHCSLIKGVGRHQFCNPRHSLCKKYKNNRETVLKSFNQDIPVCIEVLYTCICKEINNNETDNLDNACLLEQWHFSISPRSETSNPCFNINQLVSAIRSQLYFSQITAWLTTQNKLCPKITTNNIRYRISTPEGLLAPLQFSLTASNHEFPVTDIGSDSNLTVSFLSAPRVSSIPAFGCTRCSLSSYMTDKYNTDMDFRDGLVDDRMHMSCTLKGKHCCEDVEDIDNLKGKTKNMCSNKRTCRLHLKNYSYSGETLRLSASLNPNISKLNIENPEFCLNYTSEDKGISSSFEKQIEEAKLELERHNMWPHDRCHNLNDLKPVQDKGQLLLDAIERSGQTNFNDFNCVQKQNRPMRSECDNYNCDMSESDKLFSNKERNNFNIYVDKHCDSPVIMKQTKLRDVSNINVENRTSKRTGARKRITFDNEKLEKEEYNINESVNIFHSTNACDIPTSSGHAKHRRHMGTATSVAFHERTGLPLTSSPAPARKGNDRFDFDSSLNSVTAIKRALFSSSFTTDDESESDGSIISPCSPEIYAGPKKALGLVIYRRKGQSSNLLGSLEESILKGRIEPVSTVDGFTAELGASGSFVPKHIFVPVTVFFYTLGDHDNVSTPYLGHISLGKKGYNVPKSGTVQVTLFNPLGTVVKMFIIMYDLSDMPPNSQTFIRQRTLYLPVDCKDTNLEKASKWLRFLIHLRFMSSKSGKIYLHSDIRMIIMRKSDMDTATAHNIDRNYELRSFTQQPSNPRFSPRK